MIGARIGRLRITDVLGQGGMGDVYQAIDERLGRTVAVKAVRAERRLSADARRRFLREARALSALDHPNICRIHDYVETPEGDFLVLELIEGITLQQAVARGMSRPRKLRIAAEIAGALAAAHRKGIIHRDLKPQNVMIAADGTVKILDFGIARMRHEDSDVIPSVERGTWVGGDTQRLPSHPGPSLDARDDRNVEDADTLIFPAGERESEAPDHTTSAFAAAGTPLYMSPEQAQGLAVTPATDLYSFGLLLQTLLSEKPVYPDNLSADELLERVRAGQTLPLEGQPRDITALVGRLKSFAAADRPTAVETISILHRILDKPKRQVRFAAAALLVAIALAFTAKYVADVTAARRTAERRRNQAEELVSFMVGDLRTELEAAGRLDALDGAATRALAYFASLRPEELTGTNLHHHALALAQLGEVRIHEGKLDEAVRLFHESIRFAETAAARDPKREEFQLALSNGVFWLGDALRRKGDHAGALREFHRYLSIAQRLAAAHPRDAKYEAELSYGHGNVGAAYEAAGDLDRALGEYRRAVALDRRRLAREPENEKWQSDLAISLNREAVTLQAKGDRAAARPVFAEELALRRKLVAASPDDARRLGRLAVSLAYTGVLLQELGAQAGALAAFEEELAIASKLAERDPANVTLRRHRAAAESRSAALMTHDLPRALRLAQHAVAELREVVRSDARRSWRRDLALARMREATLLLAVNQDARAEEAAREALAIAQELAAGDPRDRQTTRVADDARAVLARIHAPPS
ncbi:MAG TPA: protein kinase [Thermoanaerobaculia bacterium]|nr:protein kinase [Thermoanaerobaculia bacterium]